MTWTLLFLRARLISRSANMTSGNYPTSRAMISHSSIRYRTRSRPSKTEDLRITYRPPLHHILTSLTTLMTFSIMTGMPKNLLSTHPLHLLLLRVRLAARAALTCPRPVLPSHPKDESAATGEPRIPCSYRMMLWILGHHDHGVSLQHRHRRWPSFFLCFFRCPYHLRFCCYLIHFLCFALTTSIFDAGVVSIALLIRFSFLLFPILFRTALNPSKFALVVTLAVLPRLLPRRVPTSPLAALFLGLSFLYCVSIVFRLAYLPCSYPMPDHCYLSLSLRTWQLTSVKMLCTSTACF